MLQSAPTKIEHVTARIPLNLLIIEDDPFDCEICRSLISRSQRFAPTIWEADSAMEARDILSKVEIDCILLDNCLPDAQGTKFLVELNSARENTLPAILLTGHFNPAGYEEVLNSGAYELLVKGEFGAELLERVIAFVLEKSACAKAQLDAIKAVKEASKLKSSFLAQVSHDIRNPLHQILNLSNFLQKNVNPCCAKKQEDYSSRIREASQSVLAYVDRLLNVAKMEAGHMVPSYQVIPLVPFLKKIRRENKAAAEAKHIDFYLVISDDTPEFLYTDPVFLSQIMNNLVSNAIKFTDKGWVQIQANPDDSGNYLCISVKDTGVGMKEQHIEQVFKPYIQASVAIRKEYGGAGLGLAIVKETAELLDATLTCESELGKGSTFTVTFSDKSSPER